MIYFGLAIFAVVLGALFTVHFKNIKYGAIFTANAFAVILIGNSFATYQVGKDTEFLNGLITKKYPIQRSCPTGWNTSTDSFCTEYESREVYDGQSCSGSGKDRTCHSVYHTEYRYYYPWERKWFVEAAAIKSIWEITRVNPQGSITPPFWEKTQIGDPAVITHTYKNWVKAASESLFHQDKELEEKYKDSIPVYPENVYDIWKVNRVLAVGLTIPNQEKINEKLSKILGVLGPERQMNAILVLVDASKYSDDFSYAVRRAWKGFKKNDAVVFVGTDGKTVQWASVLSWSKTSEFDINLRNSILSNKTFDPDFILTALQENGIKYYKRREMKEFEYLKDDIGPDWTYIILTLLGVIGIFGFGYYYMMGYGNVYRRGTSNF